MRERREQGKHIKLSIQDNLVAGEILKICSLVTCRLTCHTTNTVMKLMIFIFELTVSLSHRKCVLLYVGNKIYFPVINSPRLKIGCNNSENRLSEWILGGKRNAFSFPFILYFMVIRDIFPTFSLFLSKGIVQVVTDKKRLNVLCQQPMNWTWKLQPLGRSLPSL